MERMSAEIILDPKEQQKLHDGGPVSMEKLEWATPESKVTPETTIRGHTGWDSVLLSSIPSIYAITAAHCYTA